jgi:ABC-type phosphate transport system permease subunit
VAKLAKPISALPTTIYIKSQSTPDSVELAWTGALIISFAVLAINVIGRIIAGEQRR